MTGGSSAWFVVPDGIDDPRRVSGGNVFDGRLRDGLTDSGWAMRMTPATVGRTADLGAALARAGDGDLVLVDGLVATRAPGAVEAEAHRLRIVVLAHMLSAAFAGAAPDDVDGEERMLRCARLVIVTSAWTQAELIARDLVPAHRILVATPGTDDVPEATGTLSGGGLLCVGVVAPHKGQDTLVEALAALRAIPSWTCTIAGSLDVRPGFAQRVARRAAQEGLGERIRFAGVLTGQGLDREYRQADLLIAPSRTESYGMALADGLARGIPAIASTAGGIPATVAPSGAAILVPPGDPHALSEVLGRWMLDPDLRASLTARARRSRAGFPRWSATVEKVAATLAGVP